MYEEDKTFTLTLITFAFAKSDSLNPLSVHFALIHQLFELSTFGVKSILLRLKLRSTENLKLIRGIGMRRHSPFLG